VDLSNLANKAKSVLASVAPLLGTAVGGPFGTIAGAAISAALGTKKGDSPAASSALLAANPDDLLKLKQAELEFQQQMAQLGLSEDQLVFQDRASARAMEVSTKSLTPTILSYGVILAGLGAFLGVVFGVVHIPTDNATAAIFGSALTYLVTESKAILGYWFGSTEGSAKKTELLVQAASKDS
jgi:hypothetical protein